MKHQLITLTPEEWAEKTEIDGYVQRQAQSCTYLETLFDGIETRSVSHKSELTDLLGYLKAGHIRQYSILEGLTKITANDNRGSFYFDSMYSAFNLSPSELPKTISEDELLTVLSIQAVSYLRGLDRYNLLEEYDGEDNTAFKQVWTQFSVDAAINAMKVFDFIYTRFDTSRAEKRIAEVIQAEDDLIHTIWGYNDVGSA